MASPTPCLVTQVPAAESNDAEQWFARRLSFETDCADVHAGLAARRPSFVLLDVRSTAAFARGHIGGAVNLPHQTIDEGVLSAFSSETLLVVYCAGPHCNGARRAALRLAQLGRPVKEMIGGATGWIDEGYSLEA